MSKSPKTDIVNDILMRAAEQIGDITPPVMERYYARFPAARELFRFHGRYSWSNLEGEMVERSLYCLMYWFESPGEIEFLLLGSVPHHNDTLHIPPDYYQGLLTATAEVIAGSIPAGNEEEVAVWNTLCRELSEIIAASTRFIEETAVVT